METGHLLHLASIVSPTLPIRAAAVHAVFAGRAKEGGQGDFIDPKRVASLEPRVGRACLDALVAFDIPEDVSTFPELRDLGELVTRIVVNVAEIASRSRFSLGVQGEAQTRRSTYFVDSTATCKKPNLTSQMTELDKS